LRRAMPLGDLFSVEGRKKRRIEKSCERVNEKYAQSVDRFGAMEFLVKDGASAEGVVSLLRRFFWTYDKTIEDRDEKDYAFRGLVHLGQTLVVPQVRKMLRTADGSVSWLLRLLVELTSPADAQDIAAEALAACSGSDFERDPQKRIDLVHFLQDFPLPSTVQTLLPLVSDFSEEIRYVVVDALFLLKADQARDPLLQQLIAEESGRVRARIVEGFAALSWDVKGFTAQVEALLPEGYRLDKSGHVKLIPVKAAAAARSQPAPGKK
jgi:hypothetical protein